MLVNRIIGAFTFRKGVYAEVEADTSFTTTAWMLVVVFAFLNQLGSYASNSLFDWLVSTAIGTLTAVIAFAAAALVTNWVAKALYKAQVTFDELVRTMGLASVWTAVGVIGAITSFSTALSCLLGPVVVVAWVAMVVAWFVAVHEALDLDWGPTIITVIIGFIPWVIIVALTGVLLTVLGLTATGIGDLIGV
ncbi:MAG: hypothetical protein ACK2T3_04225 [Candidatus Promineifilaceae bacterium]|jgi:hypothetical protein